MRRTPKINWDLTSNNVLCVVLSDGKTQDYRWSFWDLKISLSMSITKERYF